MNEISHLQAKRLIRRQSDLLLSDVEWIALQNHLEQCPDCRVYQYRHQCMERKISQCLQARWNPVTGPLSPLQQIVSKKHRERENKRINLATAAFTAAVISFILLFVAAQVQGREVQEKIPNTGVGEILPTPIPSPTRFHKAIPLIQPGQFPHIIAYESRAEGNAEIYLLNPGFNPVNLTQHPADDIFPAWSPDGEWLAFLSNRATLDQKIRKNELYVNSIAGNQLVQLTSEPLVDWEGPLSWSGDGKWIALVGVLQDDSAKRYIYVIGIDGIGSRRLINTQGGDSPKFAPYGDRLAFHQNDGSLDRIVIYHTDTGQVDLENIPRSSLYPSATDVNFDWPADGDGPYYTAVLKSTHIAQPTIAPNCSRLVIRLIPNDEAWHEKLRDHFHLMEWEITGTVHSVSWAPKELVIFSIGLQDQNNRIRQCDPEEDCTGFLDFTASQLSNSFDAISPADLCIQSGLDRGSWSLDMRWLIFTSYEQGLRDQGLYAIRMPGLNLSWPLSGTEGVQTAGIAEGTIIRLSPGSIESSLPRMRPFRGWMKIKPHPGRVVLLNESTPIAQR